jgi:transposase
LASPKTLTEAQRQRAEMLLLHAKGMSAVDIATVLSVHPNTVYHYLHAYQDEGAKGLLRIRRRGARPRIKAAQRALIARIADRTPIEYGLPYSRWSLSKLREYLIRKHIVTQVSCEHLRRILKKRASASNALFGSSPAKIREGQLFYRK